MQNKLFPIHSFLYFWGNIEPITLLPEYNTFTNIFYKSTVKIPKHRLFWLLLHAQKLRLPFSPFNETETNAHIVVIPHGNTEYV